MAQWAAAVRRHEPGERDAALSALDDWTARDLAELKVTLYSVLSLLRDSSTRVFYRPTPPCPLPCGSAGNGGRRPVQVFYGADELRQLLDVARTLQPFGDNLLVKRGAMLHTDRVVLAAGIDSTGQQRRSSYYVIRFSDGRELSTEDAIGHWDFAVFALDQVRRGPRDLRPNPATDEWVRRWYRTVFAYMLGAMQYNLPVAYRGIELFSNDPELTFLGGALHEALASPAIQELVRTVDMPRGTSTGVLPAKAELNAAADLLRHVLKLQPGLAEAHLRLGHVLAQMERHKDARPELSTALATLENRQLKYYGELFTGRSQAALGNPSAARTAFERAAQLAPAAQSPLLALSQLAYSSGNADEASTLLAKVMALPALDGDDPWWTYNTSAGRFFNPSYEDIVNTLKPAASR